MRRGPPRRTASLTCIALLDTVYTHCNTYFFYYELVESLYVASGVV